MYISRGKDAFKQSGVSDDTEGRIKLLVTDLSFRSLSILRYITDVVDMLGLDCQSQLLNQFDFILMCTQLMIASPWKHVENGRVYKYFDGAWKKLGKDEEMLICNPEFQVFQGDIFLFTHPLADHVSTWGVSRCG